MLARSRYIDVFAPPAPVPKRRTGPVAPSPPPTTASSGTWRSTASAPVRSPRQKLVDKLMPLAKNADVHIWNERLGDWKPPGDVPEVAGEIPRARAAAAAAAARGATPSHAAADSAAGRMMPGGPSHADSRPRRPTGRRRRHTRRTRPVARRSRRGRPGARSCRRRAAFIPASGRGGAHETGGDPSSLLETPRRSRTCIRIRPTGRKTNGVGGDGHGPPRSASSDVMQMLNLPGGTQTGARRAAAPDVDHRRDGRRRGAGRRRRAARARIYILALLGVIGVIVVVAVMR